MNIRTIELQLGHSAYLGGIMTKRIIGKYKLGTYKGLQWFDLNYDGGSLFFKITIQKKVTLKSAGREDKYRYDLADSLEIKRADTTIPQIIKVLEHTKSSPIVVDREFLLNELNNVIENLRGECHEDEESQDH